MDQTINARGSQLQPIAPVRPESYVLLASLLGQPPAAVLQNILKYLAWDDTVPGLLAGSLAALCKAGCEYSVESMQNEFNKLFVGLGNGEIIPYASWYLEKKIQSRPLARLRADLYRLGITRRESDHEPEDRAAALCEVMAILSAAEDPCSRETQADFFERHLAAWMGLFFQDLMVAKNAAFYRTVGRFGLHFMEYESQYLGRHLNSTPVMKRRNCYENRTYGQPADLS
jgi:TorA maturation chaperone TorD